jgi:hypothetical protein
MTIRFARSYFRIAIVSLFLFAPLLPATSWASRVDQMDTMQRRQHFASEGASLEAIANAVVSGARRNNWRTEVYAPGAVLAELSTQAGKHRVTVLIEFDKNTFIVGYRESYNLGYTERHCRGRRYGNPHQKNLDLCIGPAIHPYYNSWLLDLQNTIADQISRLVPGEPAPALPAQPVSRLPKTLNNNSGPPTLVADEIRKLKGLHDDGILSDSEYEQQKRKLLSR